MRSSTLLSSSAVLLSTAVSYAAAFQDTSPVIYTSLTEQSVFSQIEKAYHGMNPELSSQLRFKNIQKVVNDCSADAYILIRQRGVHADDLSHQQVTPHLHRVINNSVSKWILPHCLDSEDFKSPNGFAQNYLTETCNAHYSPVNTQDGSFEAIGEDFALTEENHIPYVFTLDFDVLPEFNEDNNNQDRNDQLRKNDNILYSVLSALPTDNVVILYTSTSIAEEYDVNQSSLGSSIKANVAEVMHELADSMEDIYQDIKQEYGSWISDDNEDNYSNMVKRDDNINANAQNNSTDKVVFPDNSLFDRYQFFTPGIYMCTIVSLLLFGVLAQALVWLGSMSVSYQAFEKDPELVRSKQQ